MADFVVINGNAYEVTQDGASELEPVRIGAVVDSFSGNARSTVRAVKRGWGLTLLFRGDLSDEEMLRTDVSLGQAVPCSGDALKGVTATCIVDIGAAGFIPATDGTYGHWRTLAVTLRKAAP